MPADVFRTGLDSGVFYGKPPFSFNLAIRSGCSALKGHAPLPPSAPPCLAPLAGKPRRRFWRWASGLLGSGALLLFMLGAFVFTVQRDENSAFLRGQFLEALGGALGPQAKLVLERAVLSLDGFHPRFAIDGLSIAHDDSGGKITLERAELALRRSGFWRLSPEPTRVSFEGLRIVLPQGGAALFGIADAGFALKGLLAGLSSLAGGGNLAALRAVDGHAITVLRAEAGGGTRLLREGLALTARREGDDITLMLFPGEKGAPASALSLRASILPGPDGSERLVLALPRVKAGALAALFGLPLGSLAPELALEARLESSGAAGSESLLFDITLGGGRITPDDPDWPPFLLDRLHLAAAWRMGAPEVAIKALDLAIGEARMMASGQVILQPSGALRVSLAAEKPSLDRLVAGEAVVTLDQVVFEGEIAPDLQSLRVDRLAAQDGAGKAMLSGAVSAQNGGALAYEITAEAFDARRALRVWPVFVAPQVRAWAVQHLEAGILRKLTLRSSLAGQVLADAFNKKPLPDESLKADYRIEGLRLRPLPNAPAIENGVVEAELTGRRSTMMLESAVVQPITGKTLTLKGASFTVPDTGAQPATLEMKLPFNGAIEAMIAVFGSPSLRPFSGLPQEARATEGVMDGLIQASLRMVPKPAPADVRVEIRGDLKGVVIDNIIKGEKLEAGIFKLTGRNGSSLLKGEARVSGLPVEVELKAEPGQPPLASLKTTLDDAARTRRGVDLRPILTGPMGVSASIAFMPNGEQDIDVELDLTKAKIEGLVPGLVKKPGQAANASFDYSLKPDRTVLDDIVLDLGGIQARGRVDLLKDGQVRADLASLKLSPGDNARALIERSKTGLKVTLRGNAFDIRPFLRGLQTGRIEDGKAGDLELDLQTTVLIGFGSEILSAAEVQVLRKAGMLQRLGVKGRFGAAALLVTTNEQKADHISLGIESADAGALARFLDLYPRAYGGRLSSEILVGNAGQRGVVQARDFVIRGEPALRQYLAGAVQNSPSGPAATAPVRGSDEVAFTRLKADFLRVPGRFELNEAVMWGPQIGGSLEGAIDYAGDRVDMKGAFVPAYALNNFFAQVPLFGPLLGGSRYEGLFVLPFVISGKASAPVLRTNPISAIAPGFLRKFFEIQREK